MNYIGFLMKKRLLFLLVAMGFAFAVNAQITISLKKDTLCNHDTVLVNLRAGTLTTASAFKFELTFDQTIVRFDSVFEHNPAFKKFTSTFIAPNRIRLEWDSTKVLNFGTGLVCQLQFTGIKAGTSNLVFDYANSWCKDLGGNSLLTLFSDGLIHNKPAEISYTLTQLLEGCRKENKGRYSISISSGVQPYEINWNGGFLNPGDDNIVLGLTGGDHLLEITDGNGCTYDTTYFVKVKIAPKIRFTSDPDSVYLQKPDIQFTSNIDSLISVGQDIYSWQWNFGEPDSSKSNEANPKHTFTSALGFYELKKTDYPVKLWAINDEGCDTSITKIIKLHRSEVIVPTVITPNSDGYNDILIVQIDGKTDLEQAKLTKFYDRTEFVVLNRYGKKIFESSDYQNDWDGEGASDGTYFYVLKCIGRFGTESFQGAFSIIGSN
jgi:gliding motility-associated-like protein